jgi:sulfur-oxidizing protein SoxZ
MPQALITLPKLVRAGQVVTVQAMVGHPMETGQRADAQGQIVPKDIIRHMSVHLDDALIFETQMHAAVAANPYVAFDWVAQRSGTLRFTWTGDRGFHHTQQVALTVTAP